MAFSRDQKDCINRRSSQRSRKPNWQKGESPVAVRHVNREVTIAEQFIKSERDRDGLEVKFVSKEIGRGVFVKRNFLAGEFLMEYHGELISGTEGRRRETDYPEEYGSFIYFFRYNNKRMCLDGTFSKHKGRFVNDGIGKEKNAKMRMLKIDGRPHLAIFAIRDIHAGEEIRYDYGDANLPWRNKKTKKTVKDCSVQLVRLSAKKIQEINDGLSSERNQEEDDPQTLSSQQELTSESKHEKGQERPGIVLLEPDSDKEVEIDEENNLAEQLVDDPQTLSLQQELTSESKHEKGQERPGIVLLEPDSDKEVEIDVENNLAEQLEDDPQTLSSQQELTSESKHEKGQERPGIVLLEPDSDKEVEIDEENNLAEQLVDDPQTLSSQQELTSESKHEKGQERPGIVLLEPDSDKEVEIDEENNLAEQLEDDPQTLSSQQELTSESKHEKGQERPGIVLLEPDSDKEVEIDEENNLAEQLVNDLHEQHSNITVQPKNGNRKKKTCPKRPCPFCGKFFKRLSRHLQSKAHKEEAEVQKAMSANKDERNYLLRELKRKGYNKVNIDRIKQSGSAELIIERNWGTETERAICSFCKGAFSVQYISRHKRTCRSAEGTTVAPVSIPISLIAEPKANQLFVDNILARFKADETGNLCRSDSFIKSYGAHRFKKFSTRIDKKPEIRINVMCEMRRLSGLFLAFKEESKKLQISLDTADDMLKRDHFYILEDALNAYTKREDGSLKSGLKRAVGFLLKRAAKYLKGSLIIKRKDEEAKEVDNFKYLLEHFWIDVFDDAEYNCLKARQKELRKPKRLPVETEIKKLRNFTITEIKQLATDEYKLLSEMDYVKLRNLVVCRLTLFNARRGGEPSRLELREWEEANNSVWLDKNMVESTKDPLEKMLLGRYKLAYQSGKNVVQLVPNLIPEDCWTAMARLADPGIRQAVGVHKENMYLFPNARHSDQHASGWKCIESACKMAKLSSSITATEMRHRAATLYAALDIPEEERQTFYRHMGHSAEINKNVYQCPAGVREITTVGKFLEEIEGLPIEEEVELTWQKANDHFYDFFQKEMGIEDVADPQPSSSGIMTIEDVADPQPSSSGMMTADSTVLSEFSVQEFLHQLADDNVVNRAVSGKGLIDEEEVETIPEKLLPYSHIILSPGLQQKVQKFFTDDGWLTAQSTFKMLEDLVRCSEDERKKGKKRKACNYESDDSSGSFDPDLLESETSSSEEEEMPIPKRTKVIKKIKMSPSGTKQKRHMAETTTKANINEERDYCQWCEKDSAYVLDYFKDSINDTSTLDTKGALPGKKIVQQFISIYPDVLQNVPSEADKIKKIKTKIFNERNKVRGNLRKFYLKKVC